MSPRPTSPLEGQPFTPADPHVAEPAVPAVGVGEPKGAARQGVPSAVRPDSRRGDDRYPAAWLLISAPKGGMPTATSRCLCGRDRSAIDRRRVLVLISAHTAHRDTCPLRITPEGRVAA
ncbi:hypothetical protein HUT11_23155 [Streptomyces seoulensis]|nr:hypothetical protein HUT11_23155 [Streptomyces seoulensis]